MLEWLGLDKPPQQRARHKVWREQLVDNTRQLKLGADRASQRTDMEMVDGTEVVRAVDAPEAVPVAEDVVGTGADAGTRAEAGDGLVTLVADLMLREERVARVAG